MRNLLLGLILLFAGCTCVTPKIVSSMEVLRDNVVTINTSYLKILKEQKQPSGVSRDEWLWHVNHEETLAEKTNVLSNKMVEWAKVEADLGLSPEE